jgi:WD40 repeat protein
VSSSWDRSLRVWETGTGRPVGVPLLGQQGPVAALAYSPDARRIAAAGSQDSTLHLWPSPSVWGETVCAKLTRNMSPREWREWVAPEQPYACQCPGLPVTPSTPEERGGVTPACPASKGPAP